MIAVPRWVVAVVGVAIVVAAVDVGVVLVARGSPAEASRPNGLVAVIDPKSQRVVSRVEVGRDPTVITAGYGGVWVLNRGDSTVTQLDAHTAKLVSTLDPDATVKIAEGISEFLARKGLSGPKDLVGRGRIDEGGGSAGGSG